MTIFTLIICIFLTLGVAHGGPLKFDFGHGQVAPGFTRIVPADVFTLEKGYGFDLGITPESGAAGSCVTGQGGFFFSVALPEGSYDVKVVLGAANGDSNTTIKSESRRLMVESCMTTAGQPLVREFTVNVRQPDIIGGARVAIKEREKGYLHWDGKLTLEFNGPRPCLASLEISPAVEPVTIYLLGDSTVADQPFEPWNSWGQMLPRFFKRGVVVANYAESGESLRSSLASKRVAKVESLVKAGDYVMIQFGHNDMKDKSEGALQRYESSLRALVKSIQARGAVPVLITSMERKAGITKDTLEGYPDTVRRVAEDEKTALIDLHSMSRTLYVALGSDLDAAFQDGTHHSNFGSDQLARCVVRGIRSAGLPIAQMLVADAPAFDPVHPDTPADFSYAVSPLVDPKKPDGN